MQKNGSRPDRWAALYINNLITITYRLRSRYFHSPGTLCRALKGARLTFSGISSTASGEGLATGRPVLCVAFFLFVDIAIPVLFLSCESSPPLRKEHQLSAQSRLSGLRKPMSGPVFLVSQNPVRRYPTCPLFPATWMSMLTNLPARLVFGSPEGWRTHLRDAQKKEKGRSKLRFGPPEWISATIYPA